MGNTKWLGYLSYKAVNAEIDSVIRNAMLPVRKFSVKGGTIQQVDLSGNDDVKVSMEILEAKTFKNISLYLARSNGFEWHQLWEIAEHDLTLALSFFASGSVGSTTTHQFNIISQSAKITEKPVRYSDWDSRDVLRVNFSLPDIRIVHGTRQGAQLVERDL
jgi:hypothetical protein